MSVGHFTAVDDTSDSSWFISFMDTSNAIPEYGEIRESLITALGPLSGRELLDIGCGPGDDTRELAALAGPTGRVVGTDVSDAMLVEARHRGGRVEFVPGDVHALPFPAASFDGVRVKLVRQHSPDIDAADDEVVRVLRPGGRLAVFDFDFETLALDHPDRTTTRAVIRHWVDHHAEGWSGRQLRRRFLVRGMTDVTITPHTVQMSYDFFRTTMDGALTEAVAAGVLDVSPEEWYAPLAAAAEKGQFFGSLTGYVLGATR